MPGFAALVSFIRLGPVDRSTWKLLSVEKNATRGITYFALIRALSAVLNVRIRSCSPPRRDRPRGVAITQAAPSVSSIRSCMCWRIHRSGSNRAISASSSDAKPAFRGLDANHGRTQRGLGAWWATTTAVRPASRTFDSSLPRPRRGRVGLIAPARGPRPQERAVVGQGTGSYSLDGAGTAGPRPDALRSCRLDDDPPAPASDHVAAARNC